MAKGPFSSRHQHCTVPVNHISSVHMCSALLNQNKSGGGRSGWIKLYAIFTPGANWAGPTFQPPRSSRNPRELFWSGVSSTRTQHKDFSCSKGTHIKCECHISNVIQIWNKLRNDISWWQLSSDFWEHSNVHWKLAAGQLNIHLRSRQHLVKLRGEHRAFQI